jgi:hypothetical protein
MVATGARDPAVREASPAAGGCTARMELAARPKPSWSSHVDQRRPLAARRLEVEVPDA